MKRVYISIGSNIERYRHVSAALDALAGWFGELAISPVYESESVGFDGSDFLNLVVGVDTDMSVGELSRRFKKLEADNGRKASAPKFSPRTLDLDILTWGDAAGTLAEERARQAGATSVLITMSEDVKLVPLSADRDMFIEALVYATADGTAN